MMVFLYAYPYLLASLVLLGFFFLGLTIASGQRKPALVAAGLSAPYALASVFFVPDYWEPVRIACFVTGPEDLIFSFANGGIVWLVSTWHIRKKVDLEFDGRRIFERYVLCSTSGLVVALVLRSGGIRMMMASIISIALLGLVMLGLQRRFWHVPVIGGVVFSVFYFVLIRYAFAVFPDLIHQWNFANLSGFAIGGVPLEEILWSLAFGAVYPLLMMYVFDAKECVTQADRGGRDCPSGFEVTAGKECQPL